MRTGLALTKDTVFATKRPMKEDLRSLYDSFDQFFQEGYVKGIIRMHMSRIGTRGGLSRSEAKKKACRLNAQKRWAKVRAQLATPAPSLTPANSSLPDGVV